MNVNFSLAVKEESIKPNVKEIKYQITGVQAGIFQGRLSLSE